MRPLLSIAILLFTATAAQAQTVQDIIKTFEKPKEYWVNYDKFKDVTAIRGPINTAADEKGKQSLVAGVMIGVVFPGQMPKGSCEYVIRFETPMNSLIEDPGLIFLIGDDRFKISSGLASNDVQELRGFWAGLAGVSGKTYATGRVTYTVERDLFDRLGSEPAEFQFGTAEAFLSSNTRRNIKDLASLCDTK